MTSPTIGFVGAGQMAQALARGFVAAQILPGQNLFACDPARGAVESFAALIPGSHQVATNEELAQQASVIFLAVKPQVIPAVLSALAGKLAGKLIISVAAGVTLPQLSAGLETDRVIRVMPNTPALVGQGASAFALGKGATADDEQLTLQLLSAVGQAYRVEEKLLDAVTGLSGSGPAFVFLMIEALSDGGVRMGLPRDLATALAAQTLRGAAEMLLREKEHPGVLKDRVASPGGTTIAGLQALEDRGVRGALMAAVEAATKRSQELGK